MINRVLSRVSTVPVWRLVVICLDYQNLGKNKRAYPNLKIRGMIIQMNM